MTVLDEGRGAVKVGRGGDIGTNNEDVYRDLIEMGGAFDALSEGECAETCSGYSDFGGYWFRDSMVRKAALDDVDGCAMDGSA